MFPKIAIVVLTWNDWPDTLECLDSLAKLDYGNIDMVLADNGSTTDASLFEARKSEIAGHFKDFVFIQNGRNLGYAGGNNAGIRIALKRGAEWILILNNDTIVPRDFLTHLIGAVEANEALGQKAEIITPRIVDGNGHLWSAGSRFNWNLMSVTRVLLNDDPVSYRPNAPILPTEYVSGTAPLIRRSVFERIGLIPEIYFLYYEDAEFCTRARQAGFHIGVAPEAEVMHKISRTTQAGSPSYIYYHFRNSLLFTQRNLALPLCWMVYLFSIWWAFKQMLKLYIPSRRANGLAGLYGMRDFWLGKTGQWMGFSQKQ
jgi:GT2 family glycosyltransferase